MPCANEPVTALARPKETRTEMDIEMNRAELLTRFLLQRPAPAHRLMLAGLKPAAVLIPLVERPQGLHLLLTRRKALKGEMAQNLANLAVRGMSASGQWLAAGQTNQGAGPVSRWFGSPTPPGPGGVAPIPTTSQWTLLLIALALIGLAARTHRNTQSPAKNTKD